MSYYLGIKIERASDSAILLSQDMKITQILHHYGLMESKATRTPMEINEHGKQPNITR